MENVLLLGLLLVVVAIAFGLSFTSISYAPARPARKQPSDDASVSLYSPVWFGAGGADSSGGSHCSSDGGGGSAGCDGGGGGS